MNSSTGANSGLGEATARHLSPQGAGVVLAAPRVDRRAVQVMAQPFF